MAIHSKGVSDVTRALLLGLSLGGATLVPIGCTEIEELDSAQSDADSERILCQRVLATKNPRDLEQLIQSYPNSRCLNPTLLALPPQTLMQVSPGVLASLPNSVRSRIPPTSASFLRFPEAVGSAQIARSGGY